MSLHGKDISTQLFKKQVQVTWNNPENMPSNMAPPNMP